MRKLLPIFAVLLPLSCFGQGTLQRVQKFCESGNQVVITQGLNSTTKVQKSYPQCTVTVYLTGTTTLAAIFSDNLSSPTPLANPFTANVDGSFGFYTSPAACYDVVNSGAGFPAPFTYSDICLGSGGGGGGGTVAGTPPHVAKFTGTTTVGDSSGLDPGNAPTQWPLGLNVIGNAGYLQKTAGTGGVVANELVEYDSSGNAIVAARSSTAVRGIADVGVTAGAAFPEAVWGSHNVIVDNQTVVNDFACPSVTSVGQASDVGATQPTNCQILGRFTSANTGAGSLALVELPTAVSISPGSGGGSGTVSPCTTSNSVAFWISPGTVINCDNLHTDDAIGHVTAQTLGLTDTTSAGFWWWVQGPLPPAPPVNSAQLTAPTSIPTSYTWVLPSAIVGTGAVGDCLDVATVVGAVGTLDLVPCSGGGGGSGTVTSVTAGTGLSATPNPIVAAGTIKLADTSVTPGAYTAANITVDQQGRITAAANGSGGTGSVTSVGLSLPAAFSVSGSPVTTSGTLGATFSVAGADYLLTSTAANTAAFEQVNGGSSCGDGTHAISYDVSTHKFGCQALTTGGAGSVTSVGLSINGGSSSGIFSATGTPVTVSGTLNYNLSGTSGGIPYFSSGTTLSSSALLTANNPLIGGGAGTAPSSGSRSGNTTTFGTTSGSLTSGHAAAFDASGNIVDGGIFPSGAAQYIYVPNCASTGTSNNHLAKWSGSNPVNNDCAKITSTTDGSAGGVGVELIGVVVSGGGTTGNAKIAIGGQVSCQFDATQPATQADSVNISSTTAGDCTDLTVTPANENPESHFIFGSVDTAASAGAITAINLTPISEGYGNIGGGNASPYMSVLGSSIYGGSFAVPIILQQTDATNTNGADLLLWSRGTNGFRWGDPTNNPVFYAKMRQCGAGSTCGASGHDFLLDMTTQGDNNYDSLRMAGGFYAIPDAQGASSGTLTYNFVAGKGDEHTLTLNNDVTIGVDTVGTNPGQRMIFHICQDGGGVHHSTVTFNTKMVGAGLMPADTNGCMTQEFVYNDSGASGIPALNPGTPVHPPALTGQTTALSDTVLTHPMDAHLVHIGGSVNCTTTSAAATATLNIKYTDTGSTVQTVSVTDTCTALVTSGIPNIDITVRVKANTDISYGVTIANTPTYDVDVSVASVQ